jgi:hypothetical protein
MKLKTECCIEKLNDFKIINLDYEKEDKKLASVDVVIECKNNFIFIEEKNFFKAFLHKILKKDFNSILNSEIEEKLKEKLKYLSKQEKELIIYKVLLENVFSIANKMKGTIIELYSEKNLEKIKNGRIFYVYCEFNSYDSFKKFERLIALVTNLKKLKKSPVKIISCNKLKDKLKKECDEIK